jgi:catechol 2,3-dioxygenase-like lactoylglutathione lyase family enzyme
MQVEKVDFVSFLTQDISRAKRFYSEILGFEIETEGESDMEFRAGQVTLDIFDPASVGQPDGNALMLHRRYAPFEDGRLT